MGPLSQMNSSPLDPFNRRRNFAPFPHLKILRETASQVANQVTERVAETAAEAIERGKQAVEDLNHNLREQRERAREKKDDDYHLDNNSHGPDDVDDERPAPSPPPPPQQTDASEKDMAFARPKNVPSFDAPGRIEEDQFVASWRAKTSTSRGGVGAGTGGILGEGYDKLGGFLNPNRGTLPMYKDKPYGYLASSRTRPFYRRKSCMAWALFLVLAAAYWLGLFSKGGYERIPSLRTSDWLKSDSKTATQPADWLERRERVVEAFELSWDAYERYAWGMYPHILPHRASTCFFD